MPPNMPQDTINLIDDLNEGERIVVTYRVGGERETKAEGHYVRPEKNGAGEWCVALIGRHDARFRIPTKLVVSVTRK